MVSIKKIVMRAPLYLRFSMAEFLELKDIDMEVGTIYQIYLSNRSSYILTKCPNGWEYSHHLKKEVAKVLGTNADLMKLISHIERLVNGFEPMNDEPLFHPN
jgi:hypothetical protein